MLKDTDFMFASSRIRAAEAKGTSRERLDQMLEAKDIAALSAVVAEWSGQDAGKPLESLLKEALDSAVDLIREAVPDLSAYRFLLHKYDCANLKTAIKNRVGHQDFRENYFRSGTVSSDRIIDMVGDESFPDLPEHMAAAASEAITGYRRSGEARSIDLILDKACFADCADAAKAAKVPFFTDVTTLRADSVNVLSARRILRMKMPEAAAVSLFRRAFVPGGTVGEDSFLDNGTSIAPLERTADRFKAPDFYHAVIFASETDSASDAEHRFDDLLDRRVADLRYKPFGPEIPASYLMIRESEIRNARLIAAGLSAGLPQDLIREKVRMKYV